MLDFVHLHVHSQFSILDGICKLKDLIPRAKELGMKYLAITDHGNVDGSVKFYKECDKSGIKPICGSELYVVDKYERSKELVRYHTLVLAKNFDGLRSIMKALTVAHQEQFYYRPLVTFDQILNLENVIVMTACASGILSLPDYESKCKALYRKFGKDFYFEIQPQLNYKPLALCYQRALQLARKTGIPIIATNDVHYLNKDDYLVHEVALAIGTRKRWTDKDRFKFTIKGLHLRDGQEMYDAFLQEKVDPKIAARMIAGTLKVAEKINFDWPKIKVDLPIPNRFKDGKRKSEEILTELATMGLAKRGLSRKKEYLEQLKHELNEVISLGFATYFLILADVIWWCKENELMVGPGRGSVGGSILAYCLFITEVDPLKYGLSFERFISPGRIDLPDIDVDFQDDRREEVISYFRQQYGDENVLQVRTFNEMHGRQALRDVARVFNVPVEEVGKAAKAIIKRSGGDAREDYSIEDAFSMFEECKAFQAKYPKVVKVAGALEGVTRQGGIHAAGVVISDKPLFDGQRCVVINAKDDVKSINWDKKDLDDWGLMKLDVLGLSTLTVLRRAKELIEKNHNIIVDYEKIDLTDEKVIEQFNKGNTIGIFQFGTPGLSVYCREFGIRNFDDLVDVNALWRPGTLKSGMTMEFKEIKNGRKEVTPVSAYYDNITRATNGIMLYQEQIMQVLYQGAGIGWRTVDTIRKAISKSEGNEKIAGFKKEFMDGCMKLKTMNEEDAAAVFDKMVFFGSYGYNKAHAVEYTTISFWMMWVKVYYPTEFYCSLINFATQEKRAEYVDDARKNGIEILLPDVNKSGKIWQMEGQGKIRAGLSSITSISERSAGEILKARQQHSDDKFADFESFLKQVPRRTVNKRVIQNLGRSGALRSLGIGILSSQNIDAVLKGDSEPDAEEETPEILNIVGSVIDFSPSSDPLYKISALVDRIKKKIPLTTLKQVMDREVSGDCNFVGKIDKIKFSYRDRATKGRDDLGSAYGNFFDGRNHMMITFDQKATHAVDNVVIKKKIETAEECWVLIRGTVATDKRSGVDVKLVVRKIVFLEELIGEVDLNFLPPIKIGNAYRGEGQPFDDELLQCTACNLRDTCTAPVRPSRGKFDVMVIAEAPGQDEDKQGVGLVGKSGKILWDELAKHRITRNLVHVNNVCKCRPPNNKLPNINAARKCAAQWLDREIDTIKPLIVLAAGGVAADHFIKDAKITELNGKVIWSPNHSCWVVYCLHPASTIYEQSNKQAFSKAVSVFANMMYAIYK